MNSLFLKTNYSTLYKYLFVFLFLLQIISPAKSREVIIYENPEKPLLIGPGIYLLEDASNTLEIGDVINSSAFHLNQQLVPNAGISESTYWLRFTIENQTKHDFLVLDVQNPVIDYLELYKPFNNKFETVKLGEFKDFHEREYNKTNYLFNLDISPGEVKTYYLKVKSLEQLQIPIEVGTQKAILESVSENDLIFGIYLGIIIAMLLYNLFLYFTVKDVNYIYYVFYILTVGLTMASLQGYTFKYLWPEFQWLTQQSNFLFPALSGIAVALFLKRFLGTKKKTPKMDMVLNLFILLYVIGVILSVSGFYKVSLEIINFVASVGSITILTVGVALALKGDRQAKIFIVAWSIFLLGIFIFVLKNFGILPHNNFTEFTMLAGSAIEVVLLSFALADRINILKKEKADSQAAAFNALKENEKLIVEQNLILERKVKERTYELQGTNEELSVTLNHLKDAQSKLVESEKMASLGQLTAGIAHEINNPINFVTSSVSPLRRDIDFVLSLLDKYHTTSSEEESIKEKFTEVHKYEKRLDMPYLKEEIESILQGIDTGASRTIEIVQGLKNFSRLDESEFKQVDLHEGINSTLIILNNKLNNITVNKNFNTIPPIECYPGKLNQVFMNIISNSIHAIAANNVSNGEITITTLTKGDNVQISIKDNGAGIPEKVKAKIFEPFFTTKEIGEGTGLGLSIVYNIIKSHQGDIVVNSEVGEGAEFIITLPQKQTRKSF